MKIAAAANVMAPAWLAILAKGFRVELREPYLVAVRGNDEFVAEDPITLLGLIAVVEARGENWQATDEEIARLMAFDLGGTSSV